MKKFIIVLITLGLIVGAALGGAYFYRTSKKNSDPVKVYPVSSFVGNWYENSQSFSGNVVVNEEQNIYIAQDKILKAVYASPGDSVKVGDVILEYDSTQESLRLDTMYAQLEVTSTNLTLAERQLAKLQQVTPIEDDAEPPKTEAEKRLEAAEKAYEEAEEKTIAPFTEYNNAKSAAEACEKDMNQKESEYTAAVKNKSMAEDSLDEFLKANKIAYLATATDPQSKERRKDKDIEKDVIELDKKNPTKNLLRTYDNLMGAISITATTVNDKKKIYDEATEKYNSAIITAAEKEKLYDQAEQAVTKAEEEVKAAQEAVTKEQEEELENPTIVYTKSELAKAIRLKNEEIKSLNLSIQNQNLAIRRQEKAIEKCKVLAELDGVVRFNDVTDDVYGGMAPAIVIDATGIYSAVVNVDELSLEDIYIGEEVTILSYDNGNTYTGKISKISENPSESRGYYEYTASAYPVTIAIDEADDLAEGMWVEVSTTGMANNDTYMDQIVLPLALCKKENSSYYVMKQENGRLKKQYISTGKIYYGDQIVVKGGITSSDFIAFPYEKDAVEGKVCKEGDLSDMYGY